MTSEQRAALTQRREKYITRIAYLEGKAAIFAAKGEVEKLTKTRGKIASVTQMIAGIDAELAK